VADPGAVPAVSVVVATRRRPELLRRCLAALLTQQTRHAYEVVLVNDDTEPLHDLPDDPRVRVVEGDVRGVAAARNRGIRVARAPVVAFTDDDVIPGAGWIEAIVAAAVAHPDAAGFDGPVVVGPIDWLYAHAPRARPGGGCAASVAYRRVVLDALGGFDERFTGWMPEDVELAEHARTLGPIVHIPDMVVSHPPRPVTFRELIRMASYVEGEWLLFRRHPSLSRWRVPLRWAPPWARFREWSGRLRDPDVLRMSPVRALRAVAIAAGATAVAAFSAWRRWPGSA